MLVVLAMISIPLTGPSFLSLHQTAELVGLLTKGVMLLGGLLVVLAVARYMNDFARFKPVPCEKCGAIISRGGTTAALLCPQCRLRHLPSKAANKENTRGLLTILLLLLLIVIVAGFVLGGFVGSFLGLSYGIAVPLTAVATTAVLSSAFLSIVRILAIRDMGSKGHILGTDALIGLLRSDDDIPREPVIWALEAIAGMAYGDGPDLWTAWWNGLPADIRERRRQHETLAAITTP